MSTVLRCDQCDAIFHPIDPAAINLTAWRSVTTFDGELRGGFVTTVKPDNDFCSARCAIDWLNRHRQDAQ